MTEILTQELTIQAPARIVYGLLTDARLFRRMDGRRGRVGALA